MKVIGAKGYFLGEIKDVEFDTKNWQIAPFIVKLTDKAAHDLGFNKRFRRLMVCMPISLVATIDDVIRVELFELSGDVNFKESKE